MIRLKALISCMICALTMTGHAALTDRTISRLSQLVVRYKHATIQLITSGGRLRLSAGEFSKIHERHPMVCDSVMFSSHDDKRDADVRLDEFKAASTSWHRKILPHKACYFIINVDIPWNHTADAITEIPLHVRDQWSRRSPNHPLILVDRYKAALVLFGLIATNRIVSESGVGYPWVMYLDGDAVWIDRTRSFDDAVMNRIRNADRQPTLEQVTCGPRGSGGFVACLGYWDYQGRRTPLLNFTSEEDFISVSQNKELWSYYHESVQKVPIRQRRRSNVLPSPSGPGKYALVLSHGDCYNPSVHVHSGVFVAQVSLLAAWIFDALTRSVEQTVDVRGFVMGDQAIWDLFTEQLFDLKWSARLETYCRSHDKFALFTNPCKQDMFTLSRQFRPNQRPGTQGIYGDPTRPAVLQSGVESWFGTQKPDIPFGEPDSVAFTCPKWFNAPVCRRRYYKVGPVPNPFAFRCGDPVWHLYGCAKSEWHEPRIVNLMNSPQCRASQPLPYPEGSFSETRQWATTDYDSGMTWNSVIDAFPVLAGPSPQQQLASEFMAIPDDQPIPQLQGISSIV